MAQLKTMRKRPGVATTILGDVARRQEVDGFLLQSYAESFAEGDKAYLMKALYLCFENGYQVPAWIQKNVLAACEAVARGQANSWDAVFGKTKPLATRRRNWTIANRVLLKVLEAKEKGAAIDESLFSAIGNKIGVSKTTASNRYYEYFPSTRRRRTTSKKTR